MFNQLVNEIGRNLGMGESIHVVTKELLLKIFDPQTGGLSSFAEKIANVSGLPLTEYLRPLQDGRAFMPENDVSQILGRESIARIASAASINNASVITAASAVLPAVLCLIAPDGVMPTGIPAMLSDFCPALSKFSDNGLTSGKIDRDRETSNSNLSSALPDAAIMNSLTHSSRYSNWIVPTLVLACFAWLGWNWVNKQPLKTDSGAKLLSQNETVSLTGGNLSDSKLDDSARAALALAKLEASVVLNNEALDNTKLSFPSSFSLSKSKGKISVSGTVHNEKIKNVLTEVVSREFINSDISGEIQIDSRAVDPAWINKIEAIIAELKPQENIKLGMQGNAIKIGGPLPKATLNALLLKLNPIFGPGFSLVADLSESPEN